MQKYIGNIVVSSPNYKIDNYFRKCTSISNIDNDLPTLILGLGKAKETITDFNILKKSYKNDMLWWTFSKNEKRSEYDDDLENFRKICINIIINNIKYYNINIINLNYNSIKKLIKYINNKNKKIYYNEYNKFLFVYDIGKTKNIYGFSLNTAEFLGVKKQKILNLISSNESNVEIKDFHLIPNNIKKFIADEIPFEMAVLEYFGY